MAKRQWVNLDKDDDHAEGGVPIERIGHVGFRFRMKNTKPALFKILVQESGGKPATYSAREAKNPSFQLRIIKPHQGGGKDSGHVLAAVFLPASGGTEWTISAKHKKTVKQGPSKLVAWRRIYCQPIAYDACPVADLGPVVATLKDSFIELVPKDLGKSIDKASRDACVEQNIRLDHLAHRQAAVRSARSAYSLSKYEPAAVAALFVHSVASQEFIELDEKDSPEFSVGSRIFDWSESEVKYELPGQKRLWFGVDSLDDAENGGRGKWFVECHVVDEANQSFPVPRENVTFDPAKAHGPTAYGLCIRIPSAARRLMTRSKLRLRLKLRCIKGFSGGYSEPGVNVIVMATKSWWRATDEAASQQIFNHELGHKLGMLPEGFAMQLDPPGTLYGGVGKKKPDGTAVDQKGHQGPHCSEGCNHAPGRKLPDGTPSEWQGVPGCTMFGATSCYDPITKRHTRSPLHFCAKCQELVRRLDLRADHLPGLAKSLRTNLPA